MYKLIFSPEFVKDLDNTFEYISNSLKIPASAHNLMKEIDDAIIKLKDMPYIYPECDEPLKFLGYRKVIVSNYIIIYVVDESKGNVNLLRCFYGKRNYLRFFN